MRQRKGEAVLTSARGLFMEKGYAATSVEEIAAAAHVSKATVYSNFPDKPAVLAALLHRAATESERILADVVALLAGPEPVQLRLERTALALARGVLKPEVLQLRRLALSEAIHHPIAVAEYYEHGPGSTLRLLEAAFGDLVAEGALVIDDFGEAAARCAYAVVGPAQDRAILTGQPPVPDQVERAARSAAQAFYAAHRP